jgi:hypothetical protein
MGRAGNNKNEELGHLSMHLTEFYFVANPKKEKPIFCRSKGQTLAGFSSRANCDSSKHSSRAADRH